MNYHPQDPCEQPQSYVPQPTLTRWVGDDWKFPIQYLTSTWAKFNLTGYAVGATLYKRGSSVPIDISGLNGSAAIVGSPTLGTMLIIVKSLVTSSVTPDPTFQDVGPTRLQVWVIDVDGNRTTIAVFPLFVRLL